MKKNQMRAIMSTKTALMYYSMNPDLIGGFGEMFARLLTAAKTENECASMATFNYKFPGGQKNVQNTVHGGALSTLVDVSTTIGIMRIIPNRTISVSLATDFLSVIPLQSEVQIECQVTKIGKSLVFTECKIYKAVPSQNPSKATSSSNIILQQNHPQIKVLACTGKHLKAVLADRWTFIPSID